MDCFVLFCGEKTNPNKAKYNKGKSDKAKGIGNFMLFCSCELVLFLQNKAN
jgi:hypothetical protein